MDQLTAVNEELTLSSLEVAEMTGKRHDNLLRDIDKYNEVLKMTSELRASDFFIKSSYKDALNREKDCYLLTRKGCDMVANKMTGEKGILFSASYIERFHQMEQHIKKQPGIPADPFSQIQLIATGTVELNNRVTSLEGLIHEQWTIDYGQQRVIQKAKSRRIYSLWEGGSINKELHESTNKLFALLGKNLKDAFNVNSYRSILKKDFHEALKFIDGWRPMI
ncbi:TPA: Rha family transcriptional regulator [Bacillus pseudomycoides]|nr:Rha family transcriptional regulator [Bacillus pseudomycoides]